MRISDWSSDVCSSDLDRAGRSTSRRYDPARRGRIAVSLPIERSLLPCIDKAEHQLADEHHHRDPGRPAKVEHRDRPRIEERGFQIEDDEQDREPTEAPGERTARILDLNRKRVGEG